MMLTSNALNQEEITVPRQELDRENLGEVLATVAGMARDTLNPLLTEMDNFVTEPFLALFGLEERQPEPEKKSMNDAAHMPWWSVGKDTDVEAVIRSQAILDP